MNRSFGPGATNPRSRREISMHAAGAHCCLPERFLFPLTEQWIRRPIDSLDHGANHLVDSTDIYSGQLVGSDQCSEAHLQVRRKVAGERAQQNARIGVLGKESCPVQRHHRLAGACTTC
jgi:hypothetical protein